MVLWRRRGLWGGWLEDGMLGGGQNTFEGFRFPKPLRVLVISSSSRPGMGRVACRWSGVREQALRLCPLSHGSSVLPKQQEVSCNQHMNKWAWLYSSTVLFIKQGMGWTYPWLQIANPWFRLDNGTISFFGTSMHMVNYLKWWDKKPEDLLEDFQTPISRGLCFKHCRFS